MNHSERRFTGNRAAVRIEQRTVKRDDGTEDKAPVLAGLAAVYYSPEVEGSEYALYEDVRERLMPGCFARAISEGDDCRALRDHEPTLILGRTRAGTCRLMASAEGLRFEVDPPDTTYANDLLKSVARGDVTGCSFAFDVEDQVFREMKQDGGEYLYIREIHSCRLRDISIVTYPAYEATSVGVRSAGGPDDKVRAKVDEMKRERAAKELDPLKRRLKLAESEV